MRARHRAAERVEGPGWVMFAGSALVLLGAFHAIAGLLAVFDAGYYAVTSDGLLVNAGYLPWGVTHLVIGALFLAAGFGILASQGWARFLGIALAVVSAIANLGFLAAFPLWSLLLIALDLVIIWALVVHGREFVV